MARSRRKQYPWRPKAPDSVVDTRSLDAFKQLSITIDEKMRAFQWRQADAVLELVYELTALGFGHYAAARIIGETVGRGAHWAMKLEKVAVKFPEPYRVPGIDVITHIVALRARDPWLAIEYAAENNLTTAQFRAWIDKTEPERKRVKRTETRVVGVMRKKRGDIIIRPSDDDAEPGDGEVKVVITKKTRVR